MQPPVNPALDALVLDLVEWVASEPRPYPEVMDAWRTTCPRLAVWEEALTAASSYRKRPRVPECLCGQPRLDAGSSRA